MCWQILTGLSESAVRNLGAVARLPPTSVRGISAVFYRCGPDWDIPLRAVGDDMLFLILGGEAQFTLSGVKVRATRGQCVHIARGIRHAATGNPQAPLVTIVIHYDAWVWSGPALSNYYGWPSLLPVRLDRPMEALARGACREYQDREIGWQDGLTALTWRLLLHLLRSHPGQLATCAFVGPARVVARLEPALAAMRANVADQRTVSQWAKLSGLSEAGGTAAVLEGPAERWKRSIVA